MKHHKTFVNSENGTTFTLTPNGDPYKDGWNVTENNGSGDYSRGDISPMPYTKAEVIAILKRWYPGCKIEVTS